MEGVSRFGQIALLQQHKEHKKTTNVHHNSNKCKRQKKEKNAWSFKPIQRTGLNQKGRI